MRSVQQRVGTFAVSASHVPRVQTSRHGRVGRALDDGATVGEQRHLVGVMPEFQYEIVMPDGAMGLQPAVHFREVDRSLAFMDLHRISSAQSKVRAALAREMNEVALAAGAAAGARFRS